jgi:diadenosine tetraphosphate (Ap4A) HIT family hydrolase
VSKRCPFCFPPVERVFLQADRVLGIWDGFPVSPGHALIVSRRHVATWFEADESEKAALMAAIDAAKNAIENAHQPDGYNIGMNLGEAAGQTIEHLHVHVIPRYVGDVPNPVGGVRCVIPGKSDYLEDK